MIVFDYWCKMVTMHAFYLQACILLILPEKLEPCTAYDLPDDKTGKALPTNGRHTAMELSKHHCGYKHGIGGGVLGDCLCFRNGCIAVDRGF